MNDERVSPLDEREAFWLDALEWLPLDVAMNYVELATLGALREKGEKLSHDVALREFRGRWVGDLTRPLTRFERTPVFVTLNDPYRFGNNLWIAEWARTQGLRPRVADRFGAWLVEYETVIAFEKAGFTDRDGILQAALKHWRAQEIIPTVSGRPPITLGAAVHWAKRHSRDIPITAFPLWSRDHADGEWEVRWEETRKFGWWTQNHQWEYWREDGMDGKHALAVLTAMWTDWFARAEGPKDRWCRHGPQQWCDNCDGL